MELNISRLLITLIKKSCCALMDRIKNVLIVQHPHFPHIKSNGTVLITVHILKDCVLLVLPSHVLWLVKYSFYSFFINRNIAMWTMYKLLISNVSMSSFRNGSMVENSSKFLGCYSVDTRLVQVRVVNER